MGLALLDSSSWYPVSTAVLQWRVLIHTGSLGCTKWLLGINGTTEMHLRVPLFKRKVTYSKYSLINNLEILVNNLVLENAAVMEDLLVPDVLLFGWFYLVTLSFATALDRPLGCLHSFM